MDPRDFSERNYNLMNSISKGEGVTHEEYWLAMKPFMELVLQKAKADGKY